MKMPFGNDDIHQSRILFYVWTLVFVLYFMVGTGKNSPPPF